MSKKGRTISLLALLILIAFSFSAWAGDLLPLQGNVDLSGTPVSSGGLVVEIWDGPDVAGSTLIYNSTDSYTGTGNISAGKFDIVLGSVGDELNLEYGKAYYLDLFIAGNNMDFSNQERQIFMSSIGTINSSFLNTTDTYTVGGLNTTGDVFLPTASLASCSGKLITDSAGNITCGVDAGGSDDLTNVAFTNQTNTFITGQTIDNTSAVDAYLNISDGSTPKFIVDSSGNVGIGSFPSAYRLDVFGDINATGLLLNISNCAYGLVTDANGLLYCSPTSHTFDDISVNASIANLDLQVFNNATERVADNSTLTSMISGLNVDAYNPANIAFLNESELNNSYVRRIAWIDHDNYPDACGAGQYVTQIGDALICSMPTGTQWGWTNTTGIVYNTQLTDKVGIGTTSPGYKLEVYGDVNVTGLLQNATSCSNGFVSDANGLLYCSPTPHTFDDTSVNASIANLDLQVYNNATERTADNTTLTNMINGKTPQWGWTNTTGMVYTTQLGDKVGIGTSFPAFRLDVYGDINTTGLLTNATSCSNGFVSDSNGLLYCSPTTFIFDDTSINASVANLDTQVFNNATERVADNTTLTNMISAITTFDDASINATQSQDNSSLWNNISALAGLINDNKNTEYNDNVTVWLNLSDISTRFGTYFAFTGLLSELVNDVGYLIYGSYQFAELNETTLNNTYARLNDANTFTEPNHFNANVSMGDNLTVGGKALYVDSSSGRVGIGTTEPAFALDVVGSNGGTRTRVSGAAWGSLSMNDQGATTGQRNFEFRSDDGVLKVHSLSDDYSAYVTQNILGITYDGNVSIGTTAPTHTLNVLGTANITGELVHGCPSGMLKVGSFCIDKYEASYSGCGTTGNGYCDFSSAVGISNLDVTGNKSNYANTYPAISSAGYQPLTSLTWFQAAAMCADAGKRLCTNQEWQIAALGTFDPGSNDADNGENTMCNTNGATARRTGLAGSSPAGTNSCISQYQVEDMVGNVWEWVADWSTHPGWNGDSSCMTADYGSDCYWHGGPNDASNPSHGTDNSWRPYAPAMTGNGDTAGEEASYAAFARGGGWADGAHAGVFALLVNNAPSLSSTSLGFRCCQ